MADIPEHLRGRTAAHEAGHAVVAWLSPFLRSVLSVDIQKTLVFSADMPIDPEYLPDFLFQECRMRLAGLAGEMVAFGKCRSGWSCDDLARALTAVRRLVSSSGWSGIVAAALRDCSSVRRLDIGSMFVDRPPLYACRVLDAAYLSARRAIETNRFGFDDLRHGLETRGDLDFRQIAAILGSCHVP